MAGDSVLVDTGPLVALLIPEDTHHVACSQAARQIASPLLTSWPVITEAAWLLRRKHGGLSSLLQMLTDDTVRCLDLDSEAPQWMAELAEKYADLSPQLADLSLLYLAVQQGTRTILTLDRRDFAVYRDQTGTPFELLPANL